MTTYCDSCGNVFVPDETGSMCCPDCRLTLPGDRKSEDPWQKVNDLEQENVKLRARLRTTCQTLVEAVGADGPCDAEDAARKLVAELKVAKEARKAYQDALTENYTALRAENDHFRKALNDMAKLDGPDAAAVGAEPGDVVASIKAMAEFHEEVVAPYKNLAKGLHALALWLDQGCSAAPDENYRSQGWESLEEDCPGWRAIFKELTGDDTEGQ